MKQSTKKGDDEQKKTKKKFANLLTSLQDVMIQKKSIGTICVFINSKNISCINKRKKRVLKFIHWRHIISYERFFLNRMQSW